MTKFCYIYIYIFLLLIIKNYFKHSRSKEINKTNFSRFIIRDYNLLYFSNKLFFLIYMYHESTVPGCVIENIRKGLIVRN